MRCKAQNDPDATALAFHETSGGRSEILTWSETWETISRLASALLQTFEPTNRLLLVFPQGLEFHLCQLACNYAGLVPIPVPLPNNSSGRERVEGILKDSHCAGILALEQSTQTLEPLAHGVPVVTLEQLQNAPIASIKAPHKASDDDLAFIQYTSGSVGTPKGVIVTHGNLNANVEMMYVNRSEHLQVILSWVPHFHDMGLIGCFYLAMHAGAEMHLATANSFIRRPLSWLRLISKTRATYTTVPHFAVALCARLADTVKPGELDLSSMRCLVNSSEPIDWEGVEAFERAYEQHGLVPGSVVPHYGLAECTVMVSYPGRDRPRFVDVDRADFAKGVITLCDDEDRSQRIVNNGRGQLDCELAIVDPETKARRAADRIGEIWVTGSHVAKGYWDGALATAEAFGQQITGEASDKSWVRTGDLGFLHDGDLFITGRMKDVIIVRGQNYYARDIEILAEQASPLVRESRVVAIPLAGRDGEAVGLLAEVAPKFDYRTDAQAIVSGFTKRLGERLGLTAQALVLVKKNALPRTTSGKIRRNDAGELYRSGELASVFEYHAASFKVAEKEKGAFPGLHDRPALHDWLIQLVLAQSGVEQVADDEDLFTLGIDSLSMTNLLLEIEDLTEQTLLTELFYSAPTINTLLDILTAGHLTGAAESATSDAQKSAPQPKPYKTARQWLVMRLRDTGPMVGSLKLPYEPGSRFLDTVLKWPPLVNRIARPVRQILGKLISHIDHTDTNELKRSFVRGMVWAGWREACLSDPDLFARYVTITGLEHIQQARANGQGVILALVHSRLKGMYRLIPEINEGPIVAIGNLSADRAAFYGLGDIAYAAGATGGKHIPSARVAQIHKTHRTLLEGGTAIIFMDYNDGIGGIKVPVLDRKRATRPGIAELALDTQSVIITAEQMLHDKGQITITFKEPFKEVGATRDEKLLSLMIQQASALDEMWRTNPAQMDAEAMYYQAYSKA